MTAFDQNQTHRNKLAVMALLVGLGVVLHRVELLLPLPSPWIKLGLANIITLIALVFLGFREALTVTLLRIFLGSVVGGTFLSPTFFLSLAGGLAGVGVMGLVYRKDSHLFSLVGVSVLSAYAHSSAITLCVYLFLIPQTSFLSLLPVFLSFSLLSGIVTGTIANSVTNQLRKENISFV